MPFLLGVFFITFSARAVTSQEYLNAGVSLYQKNQLDDAAKYLKAAVQVDPKNWQAYLSLGNCLYKQNQLQDALDAFDKSLALHKDKGTKAFAAALKKKLAAMPAAPPPMPTSDSSAPVPPPMPVTNSPAPPPLPVTDSSAPAPPPLPGVGSSAPVPPPIPGTEHSAPGVNLQENFTDAIQDADGKLRYYGLNPKDHPLMEEYYAGKYLQEKSRMSLKEADQTKLNPDEKSIELYNGPKSQFYDPHFAIMLGLITPSGADLDFGYFLNPTTNVGASLCYFPLGQTYYNDTYNSTTHTYDYNPINVGGALIYIEPRIKYYSSPSGLTSYYGFSVIYYGVHQGNDPWGYSQTNFDIFGLGYLFGFRTLPMDGMTMEIGWKMGVAVVFVNNPIYTGYYNNGMYQDTYSPNTSVYPFPYIIPEFKFGFTF